MSGRGLRSSVTVDLEGNLPRRSASYEQALKRMAKNGERHLGGLTRASGAIGAGIDAIGNRYTAMLTGAGGGAAINMIGNLQERLTRLAISANMSDEKLAQMKATIFDVARAPGINVKSDEIIGALEAIIEKTGDLEFAEGNIKNIALAIGATGAAGVSVGEMLAEFQKQGITAPQEVLQTIDMLNNQGKEGAFTLQNLAALGPRVVSAYNAVGRSGPQAMREMGAALQVIRMGTGSSEQAATAFEALLRTLTDPDKIKKLEQLSGISVFDPKQLKEGKQQLRPINELMVEIVKKAGGKQTNLAQVFDAEAMRAFNATVAELNRTGGVATLEKFMNVSGDGATTMNDAARAAGNFNASLTNLAVAAEHFADVNLTGPMQSFTDMINGATKAEVDLALETAGWVAGLGAALVVVRKLWRAYSKLAPASALATKTGAALLGGVSLRALPMLGAGAVATAAGAVGVAGAAGYGAGSILNDYLSDSFKNDIGRSIARALAFFGNDDAQSAIDAERRYNQQTLPSQNQQAQNQPTQQIGGTLRIEIDSTGAPRVKELKSSGMDINVDTGLTLGGMHR